MKPNPGDHIVMESGWFRDAFLIARVVKVGPTMWEIEQLRPDGKYKDSARRKVGRWRLYEGTDPQKTAQKLASMYGDHCRRQREMVERNAQSMLALADKPKSSERLQASPHSLVGVGHTHSSGPALTDGEGVGG